MVFVAFSVGLRYSKTKHIAKGILLVFAWAISYWFIHNICLSFAVMPRPSAIICSMVIQYAIFLLALLEW